MRKVSRPKGPGYKVSHEQLQNFAAIVNVIAGMTASDTTLIEMRSFLERGYPPSALFNLFLDPSNPRTPEEKTRVSEAIDAVTLLLSNIYEESFNREWSRIGGTERIRLVEKAAPLFNKRTGQLNPKVLRQANIGQTKVKVPVRRPKNKDAGYAGRIVDVPHDDNFLRRYAARLVVQVSGEQRQALRKVIADRYDPQKRPDVLVRQVKQVVGLFERWAIAVERFEDSLRDPKKKLSEAQIQQQTTKYANKLHRARAEMIARTEVVFVENNARMQAWEDAVDEGLLDRDRNKQEWVASGAEGLCVVCDSLDGQTADIGEPFDSDEGPVNAPPAHPNCRCIVVLTGA